MNHKQNKLADSRKQINESVNQRSTEIAEAPPIMTKEEDLAVLQALSRGLKKRRFTRVEGEKALEWASKIRMQATILDLVLIGALNLSFKANGQIVCDVDPEEVLKSIEKQSIPFAVKRSQKGGA